jgi:glycosyltransferase involved in cell wall biosynthesis
MLFDCIRELKNRTEKSFIFHIAGDGALRKELENYAVKLGITENIAFHGWLNRSEILILYQKSDCLINLSFNEGMSNVILEAMACGLPVIASNVSGNDVLVEPNRNGFLFNLSKQDEFTGLLLSAVKDPGKFKSMGIFARKMVVENYSWQKVADEYVSLLNELKTD